MKLNKKTIIVISSCAAFLALLVTVLLLVLKPGPEEDKTELKAAFVSLPAVQRQAIQNELCKGSGNYTFLELDSKNLPSKNDFSDIDLVFTFSGLYAEKLRELIPSKKNATLSQKSLKGLTRAMTLAAGKKGNAVTSLPLLIDSGEILFDQTLIRTTKTSSLNTWQEIEKFALQSKVSNPFVFAGKNSRDLWIVMTMLTESFSGKDAVEKARDILLSSSDFDEAVKKLSDSPDAPLYAATHTLARWMKEGLLSRSALSYDERDVTALMYSRNAAVSLITLSHHRAIDYTTISRYVSLPIFSDEQLPYTPSVRQMVERRVVAPFVCAVPLSSSRVLKEDLERLTETYPQEALSKQTGLAPVLANCRIPDVQADDLRFWVAATGMPLLPLCDSAFDSGEKMEAAASCLRAYIRNLIS